MVAEGPASGFDRQSVIEYMTTAARTGDRPCRWAPPSRRVPEPWPGERTMRRSPPPSPGRPDRGRPGSAAAEVPPELLAQSLGSISAPGCNASATVRAASSRPARHHRRRRRLSDRQREVPFPQNLVNLFEQSTIYMLLAIARSSPCSLVRSIFRLGWSWVGPVLVAELVQREGWGCRGGWRSSSRCSSARRSD